MAVNHVADISFIVPVLNGEKTLKQTLDAIMKLRLPSSDFSFEIVAVDNASKDRSAQIIHEYPAAKYVFCEIQNRGAARNAGAAVATSGALAFVDCDVVLDQDWLVHAWSIFSELNLDGLATQIVPDQTSGDVTDTFRYEFSRWKSSATHLSLNKRMGPLPVINTAACLYSKQSFNLSGRFREDLTRNEDLELSFRMFSMGFLLGGTTRARSTVKFLPSSENSFASMAWLAKPKAYLWRVFQADLNTDYRWRKIDWLSHNPIVTALNYRPRRRLFGFALLVESTSLAAHLINSYWLKNRFEVKSNSRFGVRALTLSFDVKSEIYSVDRNIRFLFVDGKVFVFRRFPRRDQLDDATAGAVLKLMKGLQLTISEKRKLLRMHFFSKLSV